jgi:hypothetical protein
LTPNLYIPFLNDFGVTFAKRRKEVVTGLWLANPDRRAISEIGKSGLFGGEIGTAFMQRFIAVRE